MSRAVGRIRRDGLPAMLLFLVAPFAALFLGILAHPAGLLDSEEEIRARTEGWRPLAAGAAAEARVPLDLLLALVATESSGRAGAVSSADARGLTQILPSTAREVAMGLGRPASEVPDLWDPATNLRLGAHYLGERLRGSGGDEPLALAAYHRGPAEPLRWQREAPGRPGLAIVRERATPRTRAYVERVLARREWFAAAPPPAPR